VCLHRDSTNWPVKLLAGVFTQGQYLASSYWTPQLARQLASCKQAFSDTDSHTRTPEFLFRVVFNGRVGSHDAELSSCTTRELVGLTYTEFGAL
jgi:hypothetical protein